MQARKLRDKNTIQNNWGNWNNSDNYVWMRCSDDDDGDDETGRTGTRTDALGSDIQKEKRDFGEKMHDYHPACCRG